MTKIGIPPHFICPITHAIMQDPVMNRHGVNYEKEAIFAWMQEEGATDPMTRESISPRSFISNAQLREHIETFCLHHNIRSAPPATTTTKGDAAPSFYSVPVSAIAIDGHGLQVAWIHRNDLKNTNSRGTPKKGNKSGQSSWGLAKLVRKSKSSSSCSAN